MIKWMQTEILRLDGKVYDKVDLEEDDKADDKVDEKVDDKIG